MSQDNSDSVPFQLFEESDRPKTPFLFRRGQCRRSQTYYTFRIEYSQDDFCKYASILPVCQDNCEKRIVEEGQNCFWSEFCTVSPFSAHLQEC